MLLLFEIKAVDLIFFYLQKDYKNKNENTYATPENVQDIISTFYYLRNHPNIDKIAFDLVKHDCGIDKMTYNQYGKLLKQPQD